MNGLYDELRIALHSVWTRRWMVLAVAWGICILGWLMIAMIPNMREHPHLAGRLSQALTAQSLAAYDAVIVTTEHSSVDYALVARHAKLVVDSRNAMARRGLTGPVIVKA